MTDCFCGGVSAQISKQPACVMESAESRSYGLHLVCSNGKYMRA